MAEADFIASVTASEFQDLATLLLIRSAVSIQVAQALETREQDGQTVVDLLQQVLPLNSPSRASSNPQQIDLQKKTDQSHSKDTIKATLSDLPIWKLSSYGPARGEPNLIAGADISPIELQWQYYQAKGDPSQYVSPTVLRCGHLMLI